MYNLHRYIVDTAVVPNINIPYILWLVFNDKIILYKYIYKKDNQYGKWKKPSEIDNELSKVIVKYNLTEDRYLIIKSFNTLEEFQAEYFDELI